MLLSAQQLSKDDPLRQQQLLKPVDIQVAQGDRIVLSGHSGSGKSVFLRCLALIEPPTTGQIYFKQKLITSENIRSYRSQVAYVRQSPVLIDGTVLENIRLPFSLHLHRGKPFDEGLLQEYLAYFDKTLDFIQRPSSVLSGGEQQITCFLRILMLSPNILLLDEPTAALDPESVSGFEQLVSAWLQAQPERAYIWISHDSQQAERMAGKHWQMQAGQLSSVLV